MIGLFSLKLPNKNKSQNISEKVDRHDDEIESMIS